MLAQFSTTMLPSISQGFPKEAAHQLLLYPVPVWKCVSTEKDTEWPEVLQQVEKHIILVLKPGTGNGDKTSTEGDGTHLPDFSNTGESSQEMREHPGLSSWALTHTENRPQGGEKKAT
ncbi:uncharacterized protein LOC143676046 [Tamandua tetradactyla]|uniref:uncharacterized protein LOC143676046 n=1 Tax=Tamandua tetradactyla TaxID=48850 RepID=UPI0040541FB8